MSNLYNTITTLCSKKNVNVTEMCRQCGIARSSVGALKTEGRQTLSSDNLIRIAEYFNVSVDYLLGNTPTPSKGGVMIPVLGKIAAGIPIEAIEFIEDYEEISPEMAKQGQLFGLRIKGDSMAPRILDGDVIIIRKQDTCEDGDVCAVLVNGDEGTCKRVKKLPNGVMLLSNNPKYDPMFFSSEEIENLPVRIAGVVVELRGKKV